jgi:nucleoside-diphosphate-sugar epimerase
MVEAYRCLLTADEDLVQGEIFNCGFENMSIADIATVVARIVPEFRPDIDGIPIETTPSDDLRSYHVNSDKIARVLNFAPRFSVEDAVRDLCKAFGQQLLTDTLTDSRWFNVQRMRELQVQ